MAREDLSDVLSEWPYDPDNTVRIITAADGRSVMQVRLPLGVEQYELEGRPDGARPLGRDSVVEALEERLSHYVEEHGSDEGFTIDHEDAAMLQNEGVLFYYRYLLLFQINDFDRTTRDTEHNLRLCRLLERYCPDENDRNAVLQFKPYIVRMNAMARAMTALKQRMTDLAREILEEAIGEIEGLENIDSPAFRFEKVRSVNYLRSTLKQLTEGNFEETDTAEEQTRAFGEDARLARLRRELEQAVEEENYERAATLRDRIRELSS
ncbi:MAG: UvrB/UvrC motif-containing protein [Spirochaetaceae bacterium]